MPIHEINFEEMNNNACINISKFVTQVRRNDRMTIHQTRFLRLSCLHNELNDRNKNIKKINILQDPKFARIRLRLDSIMKILTLEGKRLKKAMARCLA